MEDILVHIYAADRPSHWGGLRFNHGGSRGD